MLKRIKVNLEAIEMMNYFWQAASDKENVSEEFFHEVGTMPAMTCIYDDEFNEESVRRTLSAIKNREPFTGNKKEKRFWNYNMWIMEDMEYKDLMIQRSEDHTSELQSRQYLVCRLLLEKKKKTKQDNTLYE